MSASNAGRRTLIASVVARVTLTVLGAALIVLLQEHAGLLLEYRSMYSDVRLRWIGLSVAGIVAGGVCVVLATTGRSARWAAVAFAVGLSLALFVGLAGPSGQD